MPTMPPPMSFNQPSFGMPPPVGAPPPLGMPPQNFGNDPFGQPPSFPSFQGDNQNSFLDNQGPMGSPPDPFGAPLPPLPPKKKKGLFGR